MRKILLIYAILLLLQNSVPAQIHDQNFRNLHKYWEYKRQLHDKFVVIDWGGDGMGNYLPDEFRFERSGYSIPAEHYWQFDNQDWRVRGEGLGLDKFGSDFQFGQQANENNLGNNRYGILKWGDGTLYLGHYIGVLATEYALLIQNDQANQAIRTLEELYLALQAYKRLDITANRLEEQRASIAGITCANQALQFDGYSGWFIREDAQSTIWQNFNDSDINGTVSDFSKRDRTIFHNYDHPDEEFRKELKSVVYSQDQVSHLLFGLALAKTYIPLNASVRGQNIREIINNIADGIVFGNKRTRSVLTFNVHSPKYPCENRSFENEGRGTEFWNYVGMLYAHSYITDTPVQLNELTLPERLIWTEQAKLWFSMIGNSFNFPNDITWFSLKKK